MIADLLFSVGIIAAALFALAVGIRLFLGVRYILRRVGIIGKLSGDGAGEGRGPRLQSFGDIVHAFAEAKLRKRAS